MKYVKIFETIHQSRHESYMLALQIAEKLNLKVEDFLGGGGNARTFTLEDGRVLKISSDLSEANEYKKVKGKNLKNIVKVYNIYLIVDNGHKMIVTIMEKLKIANSIESNTWYMKKQYTENGLEEKYGDFEYNMKDLQEGRMSDDEYQNILNDLLPLIEWDSVKKFVKDYFNMIIEMRDNNVKSMDYISDNLGYDENGTLKYFDLGYGDKNVDFSTMKKIEL